MLIRHDFLQGNHQNSWTDLGRPLAQVVSRVYRFPGRMSDIGRLIAGTRKILVFRQNLV